MIAFSPTPSPALTFLFPSPLLHSLLPMGKESHEELTKFNTLSWVRTKSLPPALRLSMAPYHRKWAAIS